MLESCTGLTPKSEKSSRSALITALWGLLFFKNCFTLGAGDGALSGARGGRGSSGGSLSLSGCDAIIFVKPIRPWSSVSSSSAALGTISDKKSRSSVDKATEPLGLFEALPEPVDVLEREKRLQNRETAVGAGVEDALR